MYRGHQGVRDMFDDLLGAFPETHSEYSEIRDLGDRTIAIGRLRAVGKGKVPSATFLGARSRLTVPLRRAKTPGTGGRRSSSFFLWVRVDVALLAKHREREVACPAVRLSDPVFRGRGGRHERTRRGPGRCSPRTSCRSFPRYRSGLYSRSRAASKAAPRFLRARRRLTVPLRPPKTACSSKRDTAWAMSRRDLERREN